jgi:uncharacterized protein YjdB
MEQRTDSCPSCGRGIFAEDAFCSSCGARIQTRDGRTGESRRSLARRTIPTGERVTCGSCNNPVLPGDLFCSTCGARHGPDDAGTAFDETWTSLPLRLTESSGGKYEFVRELGRGGMGIVFMARDRELHRNVAIKVLSPSWLTDEAMVQRFQREARTIASLRHEAIVSVYDVGRAGGLHYFVMDFIEGVSLSRILRTQGPLSIPAVEAILYRVGVALSYAHRPGRGIVHRDIKPSNIMLDTEGLAIVMDFGISKVSETPSGLTRTGLVMGTPEYMSPEQCRGHTVTHESDQYSLGCVLYAMLTGAPPFTGPFYQVLMAHQTDPVPPILEARPNCPPELAAATERMLGKLPGDRWPDIVDAIKALGLRPPAPDDPAIEEIAALVAKAGAGVGPGVVGGGTRRTPTSMRIIPHPDDLEVGDELSLKAKVLFPDGAEEPGNEVRWESTNPSIAQVDSSTGQLVAVAPGSALIKAAGVGLSEMVQVEVKPPQVVQIAIEPGDLAVEVGSSTRLTAYPRGKRGQALDRPVSWSSSDPRTASVSVDGVVTAKKDGSVSVIAQCEGVGSASVIRVVRTGETAGPGVGMASGAAPGASPQTSPGTEPGAIPGTAQGTAQGTAEPSGGPRSGHARPPSYAGVAAPERAAPGWVAPGGAAPERATPGPTAPDGAAPTSPARPLALLVGVPVAVLALVAGGWWMTHRPETPAAVAQVRILTADGASAPDPIRLLPGDSLGLSAAAVGAGGDALDRPVAWSSSDPAVASVAPSGMLLGRAGGTARVMASVEDVSREVTVSVEVDVAAVALHAGGDTVPVSRLGLILGDTVTLRASVSDRAGRVLADEPVRWISSSSAVAEVDRSGRVTARGVGQVVVTASAGGVSREVPVEVSRPQPRVADGQLRLQILPWANVFVDGVARGERTSLDITLSAGRHRLRLENPAMVPVDTIFEVRPGARVQMNFRMRARDER